jgi:hypothetical protein
VLKDVTNKEPTTPPRTLRNIASKLSLSGKKKSSQQEKEMVALDKIEEQALSNLPEMAEEADKLPEPLFSISRRRGFRPLSIHTGKAFDPFGFGGVAKPEPKDTKTISNDPETIEADFATLASCARERSAFHNTSFILNFSSAINNTPSAIPARSLLSEVPKPATEDNF